MMFSNKRKNVLQLIIGLFVILSFMIPQGKPIVGLFASPSYKSNAMAKDNTSILSVSDAVFTGKTSAVLLKHVRKPTITPTPVITPSPTPVPTQTIAPTATPVSTSTPAPISSKVITGYYASWSAYSGYTPLRIPASKLTMINYAFAKIGTDLRIAMGDTQIDPTNFTQLNQLKQSYPNVKTLISIGGWNWSNNFSDAALTDDSRTAFADSVVTFILKYGFNGADIDWEYPVSGGLSTNNHRLADKTNFTLLLQTLRAKLDAQTQRDGKKYYLTIAGGAGSFYLNNTEPSRIAQYIDYADIMAYDIHGSWDQYADFNAPLYTPTESSPQYKLSDDSVIKEWIATGFPSSKLILGMPFYGYIYKGVTGSLNHGLYGSFLSASSISYDSIVSSYLTSTGFTRYFHATAQVPWLYNGTTFISYDDADSITRKANYVLNNQLAGASIWELSQNQNGALLGAIYTTFH